MGRALQSVIAEAAGFAVIATGAATLVAVLRVAAPESFSDPAWARVVPSGVALGGLVAVFVVFRVARGFVTARLATRGPVAHTAWLGAAMTAVAAVNSISHPADPIWYRAALVASSLPACLAGGVLGRLPHSRHAEPPAAADGGDV